MGKLRVLFIGGSGVISSACSRVAVEAGIDLFVLNRGRTSDRPLPPGVTMLRADVRDPATVRDEIKGLEFDAVTDWVAFTPAQVRADIDLFRGRTGQYVFISSASAYQTPPARVPVTESTPLRNPYWQYSRDKIACEDLLVAAYREEGFPATIVRPSHTYDATLVPFDGGWTVLAREHPAEHRPPPVERDQRRVVGVRRPDDRGREALLPVRRHEQVLAGDLVAGVLPERVAQRRRLGDRHPRGRRLVGRRGADEHVLAGPPAEQVDVGADLLGGEGHPVHDRVEVTAPDFIPNGLVFPHIRPQHGHAGRKRPYGAPAPV